MKYLDINALDKIAGRRLGRNDTFSFQCHPGLSCFNKCCRNLNLFLYPYDVVRLKNKLGITSDEFIDRHADIVMRDSSFFPDVLLRMSQDEERTCPFLSESGCLVYPDRPDTCRTFPVEQGAIYDAGTKKTNPVYFFRPPDFCLGQYESEQWTTESWAKDQDAVIYNKMTIKWSELKSLFQVDPWGREGPAGPKGKMAFMAIYNIDLFRDFLFKSSFLKRYKIKHEILKRVKKDDVELMKLCFEWVKYFLWGIKTKTIRIR